MGRNNFDFQDSAMFHGSPHAFGVGDVVEPRGGGAYATNKPDLAKEFGAVKAYHVLGPKSMNEAKVYRVEPLDKDEVTTEKVDEGSKEWDIKPTKYFTSKKGFRVLGEHDGEK